MSQKIILGFVGDLAAGKGTVAAYLKEKYSCTPYRFSTMLRDVLSRLYIEKTRENLQKISTLLRQNFSEDIMSRVIAEDVKNDANDLVVVEGVRRPTDITYLEKNPGFKLVYITADSKLRFERLKKRNENPGDDTKTYAEFLHDEQSEADRLIKSLGQKAPYTITNNGTFEELYAELEVVLMKIKNEN